MHPRAPRRALPAGAVVVLAITVPVALAGCFKSGSPTQPLEPPASTPIPTPMPAVTSVPTPPPAPTGTPGVSATPIPSPSRTPVATPTRTPAAGTPTPAATPPPPTPTPPPSAPTLSSLQAAFLTSSCGSTLCHGGSGPAAGLNLTPGHTWGDTVGIASREQPSVKLVVPGDSGSSYLVWKLRRDPRASCCAMPPGPALPAGQVSDLAAWIDAGALDN